MLRIQRPDLELVAGLIGQNWRLFTGRPLKEKLGYSFAWDAVAVATANRVIQINTSRIESDFRGFPDFFTEVDVTEQSDALDSALALGKVNIEFAKSQVLNVLVLREDISHSMFGEHKWDLSCDYAVVFELEHGVVAVFRHGYHTEALLVTSAKSIADLAVDEGSVEFTQTPELGEQYRVTRELIPIDDLLNGTKS